MGYRLWIMDYETKFYNFWVWHIIKELSSSIYQCTFSQIEKIIILSLVHLVCRFLFGMLRIVFGLYGHMASWVVVYA